MSEQIYEQGIVLKSENGIAEISLTNSDSCASCDSLFCSSNSKGKNILIAENTINAKSGDFVKVMVTGAALVNATLLLYVLPLIILVGTIIVFYSVMQYSELFSVLAGFLATTAYYLGIFTFGKNSKQKKPMPKIINIKKFNAHPVEFE